MQRLKGLVVEDQSTTREWLVGALDQAFDIEIVAVDDLRGARESLQWRTPDVALVDIGLPDGSGVDLVRELTREHPAATPIVTTIFDDDAHLFDAIAAGAQGYLLKDQDTSAFVQALRRIERGEPPLSPSIARRMLEHFRAAPPLSSEDLEPLTPRETEVLALLGRGLRVGEAARVLGISEHTVAGYVKTVYRKLNIASRAEAALEAARRGLV
ncbi:response regulator transcription factor [Caulobacter segnis]|uniref:response regulator transcription factor n=1 Tax=Caulobacter segnis TaxID=88688 RepID=UPI00240FAB62|nr:response regulator transcription factor [Caulobacter segnis]MDG2521370.1 response regulator transcription factor [Caulobacter segnis]